MSTVRKYLFFNLVTYGIANNVRRFPDKPTIEFVVHQIVAMVLTVGLMYFG